jgi:hypothetical protein
MVTTSPAAPTASHVEADADPAIARKAGPRDAGAMGPAVMWCDDFNVLFIPAPIRLLILDADVWKMHRVVEIWQLVFARPLTDLICGSIKCPS